MGCPRNCSVLASHDQEDIEAVGYNALAGHISWREAGRLTGIRDTSLKKHMQDHVVAPVDALVAAQDESNFAALVATAKAELEEQFHMSSPDIKPIILVAIKNLEGLAGTKPSADVLVRALKTIQEMTGMKNEQRLMLDFARAQRTRAAITVPNLNEPKALEGGEQ